MSFRKADSHARDTDRTPYDRSFFDRISEPSLRSARRILPLLFDYIGTPTSVVDVGCGTGQWLHVCRALGVEQVVGIDGEYVDTSALAISQNDFVTADLTSPPSWSRQFDLAICLEVAEHLPAKAAEPLIQFLTALSGFVLFSAAVPGQKGVGHINEQWPPYWARLFREAGFVRLDPVRPVTWQDPSVERFYSQNAFLFVSRTVVDTVPRFGADAARHRDSRLTLLYDNLAWHEPTVRGALRLLRGSLHRSLRRRLAALGLRIANPE